MPRIISKATQLNIIEAYNEIKATVIDRSIYIGEELTKVKDQLPHGEFQDWVEERMPFSLVQAQRFMRVYKNRKKVKASSMTCLTDAIKLLSGSQTESEQEVTFEDEGESEHIEAIYPKNDKEQENEGEAGGEDEEKKPQVKDPAPPKDRAGTVIPEHLIDVFQRRDINILCSRLNELLRDIEGYVADKDLLFTYFNANDFEVEAANLKRNLRFSQPFAVCPYCGGNQSENCKMCRGGGWINQKLYETVPEELK